MKRLRRTLTTLSVVALAAAASIAAFASPASAFSWFGQSNARPGIAYAGGTLYAGWTGTDSAHQVNIGTMSFTSSGLFNGWAAIDTMSGTSVYPGTGPAVTSSVVPKYSNAEIIVAWAAAGSGQINVAHYVGTSSWGCATTLNQYTNHSPYLIGIGTTLYLAWTGLDPAHHVNILKLTSGACPFNANNPSPVTLGDTATAGPALTTDGAGDIFVAWPGTGSGQNLWAGQYVGTATLAHHTCFCQYKSADDIGLTIGYGSLQTGSLSYHGTNNRVYILNVTLSGNGISSGGQVDGGAATGHGVDVTAVTSSGTNIPAGTYDSYVDAANSEPSFNWVGP